jgi:hypothetical protein
MKLAKVRETTAIGEYKHHAKYNNWYDSVLDYKLFQEWYSDNSYDMTNYTQFLKDMGYATNIKYISLIEEMS